MYVSKQGTGNKSFVFSIVNGRHHFKFSSMGKTVDFTWYNDLILRNESNNYALLVFQDGRAIIGNSNEPTCMFSPETICSEVFLLDFDKHFQADMELLPLLPACVRCIKGILFHHDGHGNYDITDGANTPLFNISGDRLLISKVTMERIRSKLPADVAVDVSSLFRQLSNFTEGVSQVE